MGGFLVGLAQGAAPAITEKLAQHGEDKRNDAAAAKQLVVAPLSQQLSADRLRLASYVDPKTMQPLAGHEDDYSTTLNRMADTIGQIRGHMGDTAPHDDPNGLKMAAAKLLDRTHITNDLTHHVQTGQTDKANKYAQQNLTSAATMGSGAVAPPAAAPDAWNKFSASYKEATGNDVPPDVAQQFARKQGGLSEQEKVAAVKPSAPLEVGGVMYGVRGPDGKEYTASQMNLPTTPPEVKELYKTVKDAQESKQTEAQKKEQAVQDKFDKTQAAIESRFERSQANQGTWQVAEGTEGKTQLFNTKTGAMRDAPVGLHKSGYYVKQVAPLESAALNIKDYMDSGTFTGPGDLDLQHQFFTATQPATGFRMTKVQQDILQNSQSLINKMKAGAAHLTGGTIYSPEQRQQIAAEAQKAIEAKKTALEGSQGGPKTEHLRNVQSGGGVIVQKSKTTGAYRHSVDGGKTWLPGQQ